jgi:hypothetical protein
MSAWATGLVIQGSNVISQDYVAKLKNWTKLLNDRNIYELDKNKLTTIKYETRLVYQVQFYAGIVLLSFGIAASVPFHERHRGWQVMFSG